MVIRLRKGTAEWFTTANPVLKKNELGLEIDTAKIKFGDGETLWVDLDYTGSSGGLSNPVTEALSLELTDPDGIALTISPPAGASADFTDQLIIYNDDGSKKIVDIDAGGDIVFNMLTNGEFVVNSGAGHLLLYADDSTVILRAVNLTFQNIPTSDPHVNGVIWNNAGTVKISSG